MSRSEGAERTRTAVCGVTPDPAGTRPDAAEIERRRALIAEARAYNAENAGRIRDEGPLPELYPGHYEDFMGVSR